MAQYIGTNFYIKPTYIVALPEYDTPRFNRSEGQRKNEVNLRDNNHGGALSKKSQAKLRNAVNWLVSSAKDKYLWSKKYKKAFRFKINFITLTFPFDGRNPVSEKQAKRCIHSWISYSRKYSYLRNYIWKFEVTRAGQLHVHFTTDTFIAWRRIRTSWNRIVQREGLLSDYFQSHGHFDANSTDVHSVRNIKNLASYICKYMAKADRELPQYKGRIWACNREISDANKCSTTLFAGDSDICQKVLFNPSTPYKAITGPPDKFGNAKKIGEIFLLNEKRWQAMQSSIIKNAYDEHRYYIRNNIEKLPKEYWQQVIDEYFDSIISHGKNELQAEKIREVDKLPHVRLREKRFRNDSPDQLSLTLTAD